MMTLHGEGRTDDDSWLRDKADTAVIAHLDAEDAHTAAVRSSNSPQAVRHSTIVAARHRRLVPHRAVEPDRQDRRALVRNLATPPTGLNSSSNSTIRSATAAASSSGTMTCAAGPCFSAFTRDRRFPASAFGPVLRCALFRFASNRAGLQIMEGTPRGSSGMKHDDADASRRRHIQDSEASATTLSRQHRLCL